MFVSLLGLKGYCLSEMCQIPSPPSLFCVLVKSGCGLSTCTPTHVYIHVYMHRPSGTLSPGSAPLPALPQPAPLQREPGSLIQRLCCSYQCHI